MSSQVTELNPVSSLQIYMLYIQYSAVKDMKKVLSHVF